ncbi:contractile injection system protein, VgrG/Pvc8 family [Algicola sagamiensis]|uniref:contractile injection system protein, VgrG/Pvc8 family n=1 Tax=Algicola sagamiensis TaxID=163869 RepID=UPI0003791773|nr:contractile injection system protein, VgrG/Pvc8 family [Algicola sagamiensis]
MKPTFQITANNQDITQAIKERLLRLRLLDNTGLQSDSLAIHLDNKDYAIQIPPTGAELKVAIGYEETSLVNKGTFIVDEVELTGPPDTLIIRAKAADMKQRFKSQQTKSHRQKTLKDITKQIATDHGLIPKVFNELGNIIVPGAEQTQESDLHFLTRLSKEFDAIAKPVNGYLVIAPKGQAKSQSGQPIAQTTIHKTDLIHYRMTQAERGKYKSVLAHWDNTQTGERESVKVGQADPIKTLRKTYATPTEATLAATAELKALERGELHGSLTLIGNPKLVAEGVLNIEGVTGFVDGKYVVKRVEHEINGSGYRCRVDVEVLTK